VCFSFLVFFFFFFFKKNWFININFVFVFTLENPLKYFNKIAGE